jgi:serine protease inhibitor
MKNKILFSFVLVAAITSCKKTGVAVADQTQTIVLPSNGASVINASNQFAFNFLKATLQQDSVINNKLISPLSIYLALSMVYNGADNATRDSIAQTLQLSGIDINDLNTVCQSLLAQFPAEDNHVQLSIANSIWYRQNSYQPLTSFLNVTKNYYDADVQALNFANEDAAVNTINNWVSQKTNNKIPTIIKSISQDDLMYLINAIYFNGAWKTAFNTSDTYNDNFHLQNGSAETVPFMKQQLATKMYADSLFTLIELPYGGGKSYSMYIALPDNQQQPLSSFASLMNENILQNAISKMDSVNTELIIPKWEYSYAIENMQPELTTLGMGISFGDAADFSKIYNPAQVQVYISKAIHKTYIKVNEEGTEAAAVTAVGIATATASPANPVFKIDHPFLYTIIEKQTGAVLFAGVVNDPSVNGNQTE